MVFEEDFTYLKVMVPTSGPVPAQENAEYVLKIAKKLNAQVIVVHIRDRGESREGDLALDIYDKISKQVGVKVRLVPAIGEVSQTIIELARFEDVDLIIMGATGGRNIAGWIIDKIINKTDIHRLLAEAETVGTRHPHCRNCMKKIHVVRSHRMIRNLTQMQAGLKELPCMHLTGSLPHLATFHGDRRTQLGKRH